MSTPDELLRNAIAAHNAGRLTEAEVGYSRVLRKQPNDAGALYGLGLLSYHSGSRDKGIQYLVRTQQWTRVDHARQHVLGDRQGRAGHRGLPARDRGGAVSLRRVVQRRHLPEARGRPRRGHAASAQSDEL